MSEENGDEEEQLPSGRDPKIVKSMKKYGLDGMGDDLERKWTQKDRSERYSIRELATYFNSAIVEQVFKDIGHAPAEIDAEEAYELLHDDDAPQEDVEFIRTWLRQNGVDPDELTSDFVSYHTVFNYLREVRDVESPDKKSSDPSGQKENAISRIKRLQRRLETISEGSLRTLRNNEIVPDRDFSIRVNIRVECPNCGRTTSIIKFLRKEGCKCDTDESDEPDGDARTDGWSEVVEEPNMVGEKS